MKEIDPSHLLVIIAQILDKLKISGKKLDKKYLKLWIKKLRLEEIWNSQIIKK